MQQILSFALVRFALGLKITPEDAARQLIYDSFSGYDVLTAAREALEKTRDKILPGEDPGVNVEADRYSFFACDESREDLVWDLIQRFREDSNLKRAAITHTQLSKINDFFGVQGPCHDQRLKDYHRVNNKIKAHQQRFGQDPAPTVETGLFFDLMEGEDPLTFCAYMAIRSIIGKRKYCKTTKEAIRQRMFGAKSANVFEHLLCKEKAIFLLNEKTSRSEKARRYWLDKMINKLQNKKLVTKIGIKRRLYLSCTLSYSKLAEIISNEHRDNSPKKAEIKAIQIIKNRAGNRAGNGAGSGAAIIHELFYT